MAAVACAVAAALAAAAPLAETAAGHGIGAETIRLPDAAGRDLSVGVEVAEDPGDPAAARLAVTVLDDSTRRAVGGAVLEIGVSRGGQELARDRFAVAEGALFAVMSPPNPLDEIGAGVSGERDVDGGSGAWRSEPGRPVEIRAPGLGGPGLYTFDVRLASVDGIDLPGGGPSGRADVSVAETAVHELAGSDNEPVPFKTRSYFDRVSSLEYDPDAGTARLEMPFDWSDGAVSHVPVVHVEIHFPKGLAGFTSPSYTGAANGVGLFKSSVTVDDYTEEDERIVHFVLLGDHLRFVKARLGGGGGGLPDTMVLTLETSQESRFPMTAYTPGEELRVDLTWEPPEVAPGDKTNFIFTIRDGATGDPLRRSSYDFVIVQGGEEVHRAAGDATVGGSFEQFTFSEGQTGPTVIRFEDIRGTGASTEFALVVVPEFSSAALLVLAAAVAAAAAAAPALMRPGLRAPAP